MTEISIHQKFPTPLQFPTIFVNHLGLQPHTSHTPHAKTCGIHSTVGPHPSCTTSLMPPLGTWMKIPNGSVICPLQFETVAHPIWKPTMHSHPHIIQHSLFAHILCPYIHHSCFVALFNRILSRSKILLVLYSCE